MQVTPKLRYVVANMFVAVSIFVTVNKKEK